MKVKKDTQQALDALVVVTVSEWGAYAQLAMVAEECVELAHASLKLLRAGGDDKKKRKNAIEEIADVLMMINQLEYILDVDQDELDLVLTQKIDRTCKRLKE
jgi:NTP pyrophosphatase (non-canonical NTP hydrolase)